MYRNTKMRTYVGDRYAVIRPYFIELQVSTQDVETTGTIFPASTVTTDKTQSSNTIEPDPLCFTLSVQFCVNIHTSRKARVLSGESDTVSLIHVGFRSILIIIIMSSTTLAGSELQRRACQRKL